MKQYAKLIDGVPMYPAHVPHISNATTEQLESYATSHGYKLLVYKESPGRFYTPGWHETEKRITRTWTPWPLADAKKSALESVQSALDARLTERTTLPCVGISAGIVYDPAALTNALGMEPGDVFIDAEDKLHTLTAELIQNIRSALKNHRLGLYAAATDYRRRITAAENVDAVEEAVQGL